MLFPLKRATLFAAFLILTFGISCSDDDEGGGGQLASDAYVNNWIYATMSDVYLWTDHLPSDPDGSLEPTDFFESILYSGDRFSFIHPNYDDLVNALRGINLEAGYEFVLRQGTNEDVTAIVTYVKNGSPAEQAGLKRGDRISAINGTSLNLDNYQTLLSQISSPHDIGFSRYDLELDEYITQSPLSLTTLEFQENPHYLDTVYSIEGRKIGYHVYQFFNNGSGNAFDNEMDEIFLSFKNVGITDLVLDLRYNSGGLISSATNLASLIVPNATDDDIFYQNQWNDFYQELIEEEENADDILRRRFSDKDENIGGLLDGRIYILTGSNTASASELVINGLLPYMNVILIGTSTVGKNVGSIPINDEGNEDNTYGLLPIVLRTANSLGDSDYTNGFFPDAENTINEFASPLLPLGDVNESLLAHAIFQITGGSAIVARKSKPFMSTEKSIYSSRSAKAYSDRSIFQLD